MCSSSHAEALVARHGQLVLSVQQHVLATFPTTAAVTTRLPTKTRLTGRLSFELTLITGRSNSS